LGSNPAFFSALYGAISIFFFTKFNPKLKDFFFCTSYPLANLKYPSTKNKPILSMSIIKNKHTFSNPTLFHPPLNNQIISPVTLRPPPKPRRKTPSLHHPQQKTDPKNEK
jgi:hypothetical protein